MRNKTELTCQFSCAHLRELLCVAADSGYSFELFSSVDVRRVPFILLRHDVDYAPVQAVEVARLESELGIWGTYFFLLHSVFYNVFDKANYRAILEIAGLGHEIGVHFDTRFYDNLSDSDLEECVLREQDLFGRLLQHTPSPAVSFHNPGGNVLGRDFSGFLNTYAPRFFGQMTYLSDSNQRWRSGCPCGPLQNGDVPRLQILIHPELWGANSSHTVLETLDRILDGLHNQAVDHLTTYNDVWRAARSAPPHG